MYYIFSGELRLKNVTDKLDYFVYNKQNNESDNLTSLLWKIYKSDNPNIKLHLAKCEDVIVDWDGELYRDKNRCGIYDWFIGFAPLGDILFDITGEEILMTIEDYITEAEFEGELNEQEFTYDRTK